MEACRPPAVSPVLFLQIVPVEMKKSHLNLPDSASEVASNLHAAICCVGSPVVILSRAAYLFLPVVMKWKTAIYLKGSHLLSEAPGFSFSLLYMTSMILGERVLV